MYVLGPAPDWDLSCVYTIGLSEVLFRSGDRSEDVCAVLSCACALACCAAYKDADPNEEALYEDDVAVV